MPIQIFISKVQRSLKYVCRILDRGFDSQGIFGLADLRPESYFVGFLKPRPKLRDLRFDNMPSGWSDSSTERFPGWDIIPTQVPNFWIRCTVGIHTLIQQRQFSHSRLTAIAFCRN